MIKLWKITYGTGRIACGIMANNEEDARRAANWLHPSERIERVDICQ